MSEKMSDQDELMKFVEDKDSAIKSPSKLVWRILIVDDEKDVHLATTFALRNTEVVGRKLEFLHANSAREAKVILQENRDIAVILLDVVMETPNAGLELVPTIRRELGITDTRIILRTGLPNQAPEIEVIRDYDVNDYRLKSELTHIHLFAALTTAIRSYKQVRTIQYGGKSLLILLHASAKLLNQEALHEFSLDLTRRFSELLSVPPEGLVCVRSKEDGLYHIVSAGGRFFEWRNLILGDVPDHKVRQIVTACFDGEKNVMNSEDMAVYLGNPSFGEVVFYIKINEEYTEEDRSLLELFSGNPSP